LYAKTACAVAVRGGTGTIDDAGADIDYDSNGTVPEIDFADDSKLFTKLSGLVQLGTGNRLDF
jgi:hypothetical protein